MSFVRNINSIQVFDVTARLGNVTRAASELNISQSSISYHLKKLETDLGVQLFYRRTNGLELTEAGTILASHVDKGLGSIRSGMEAAARSAGSVRVAVLPMFASRFLSSRLGEFWERHPDLQLSIQSHNNTYARQSDPQAVAEIGIQWGLGNWSNFQVTRLWPEKLVVVCSPEYLAAHRIRKASDLCNCTLLHVDDERMWSEWFQNSREKIEPEQPQMMLEDRHFQLSSTINGLGVSLFAEWLVADELKSGVLVNPFKRSYGTGFGYHIINPKDVTLSEPATIFRQWVLDTAKQIGKS